MNRCTKVRLAMMVVMAASAACTLHASKQDPEKAAAVALEFATAAVIDRDMDRAYGLLDPEAQSNASKEKFAEILTGMHPDGSPTKLAATEFEPTIGEDGVSIYLTGDHGGEKLYYRIPMRGNEKIGYKPVGILRGQYAPSESRQPLQTKPSTGP